MFKVGDRIVVHFRDLSARTWICQGRSGVIVRRHEVQGAWYVRYDCDGSEDGLYEHNLKRSYEPASPFEKSLYAYIERELT